MFPGSAHRGSRAHTPCPEATNSQTQWLTKPGSMSLFGNSVVEGRLSRSQMHAVSGLYRTTTKMDSPKTSQLRNLVQLHREDSTGSSFQTPHHHIFRFACF